MRKIKEVIVVEGRYDILAGLGFEVTAFVPVDGHIFDELEASRNRL